MTESSTYRSLIKKLDAFIRKYYTNQIIKGFLYSISIIGLFFLLVNFLEFLGRFGSLTRSILFFGFLLGAFAVIITQILIPLLKLYRLGKIISHEEASRIIGVHFPHVNDKLVNTLQLHNQSATVEGDKSLLFASIDQKSAELNPVPFSEAIDFRQNKKYLKYALPPLVIVAVLLLTSPALIKDSSTRLVYYSDTFEVPAPFHFKILNESLQVPRKENYKLMVSTTGDVLPEEIYIEIEDARYKLKKDGKNEFSHEFKNVQEDQKFVLTSNEVASNSFILKALPNPLLVNFEIALDFPKHTGLKNSRQYNSGNLKIPEGTHVAWKFNTQHTDEFRMSFPDTTVRLNQQGKDLFGYEDRFFTNNTYSVSTANEFMRGKDSLKFNIQVIKDSHPSITAEETRDSLNEKHLYFGGLVTDDYGLKNLYFHYSFNKSDGSGEGSYQKVPVGITSGSKREEFFHHMDLTRFEIKAGDEVNYYFEVWDNDGVNGSKSARSATWTFKAPTLDELKEAEKESIAKIEENLEKSLKEARELQKEMDKLQRDLLEKKTLNWQEKQKLENLLNKQKKLENQIDDIRNENKRKHQQQAEYSEQDERIMEKQMQLEKLFEDIMTEEMKKLYQELEEMLEKLDKTKIQEQLEKIDLSNHDIEKELDRSLELFKKMEVEQKMEETIEKLQELAQEQKELSEKTKEGETPAEELKKEQSKLEKEFENLEKDLQEILNKNKELEQSLDIPDTSEDQEKVKEEMKNSQEQMDQKKNKKASESQQNAQEQMEQMAMKMQNSMQQQQGESLQEDMAALRALLENIIQLSFDQEEIMEVLRYTDQDDPLYVQLGQKQKKIQDDTKIVEDSLFALSKRIVQIEATVNREISQINNSMKMALEEIAERRTSNATGRQQYAMTSFNNLALLLDEAFQQMQMQMASKMPGTGNCEKPGGSGQTPSSSEQMSKMQKALEKKLEQMQKALEKGNNPGSTGKPGEGSQGLSKEIAKMAAEQEAIRREIEKIAQSLNEQGNGAGNELKKIAEKMEKNEKDLVNKQITRETLQRQEEIVTRLLEHEKAERQREYDDKRKSNEAKDVAGSNPLEYLEYKKRKEKEVELLRTMPPELKPYYKGKVNEYFSKFDQ